MSGANPVEAKAGTAAALNPPAPSPAPTAGRLGRYLKPGVVVAGSALVLAGGWYGFTHFRAVPPAVVAQSDAARDTTPPETRPDEPVKRPDPSPDNGPDIKVPAVPIVSSGPDKTDVPKLPDSGFAALPPAPVPDGKPARPNTDVPLIEPPPIPSDPTKDKAVADTAPPVLIGPLPDPDKKKAADHEKSTTGDPFKAPAGLPDSDKPKADGSRTGPAPLPGDMTDQGKLDTAPPVIRSGGTGDPMPPAPPIPMPDKKDDGPPPVPTINVDVPAPPKPDADKRSDLPPLVLPPKPDGDKPDGDKPDAVKPPAPAPDKKDDIPTLVIPTKPGPAAGAKKDDLPTIPKIDLTAPEAVKPPAVTTDPPTTAGPMPVTVAPPAAPKKKDTYDEDWHTPRPGDTFVTVSQEYYHDSRYAPALEAYNKDRRKADEKFIRVPPPWVLKEQFPNLAPKDDDRPAGPEAKPTGNIKFEPAAPVTPIATSRPAPPSAGTVPARTIPTDEYRVIAKEGESIREIARKTLGDANAWRKLWDLNPDVDPTQPIPVGTTLRVPR